MCFLGYLVFYIFFFFFFKQKTAYEMRISDWSSDVCSSDLSSAASWPRGLRARNSCSTKGRRRRTDGPVFTMSLPERSRTSIRASKIGRATSELQSLMRISYAVFCLKQKTQNQPQVRKLNSETPNIIITSNARSLVKK